MSFLETTTKNTQGTSTPSWAKPRTLPKTRIITLVNHKGGVGKTTTAINMSAGLALAGRRVLLVDNDPQHNSTTGLGIDPREGLVTITEIYEALGKEPLSNAIYETSVENLYLVPSDINLALTETTTVQGATYREGLLRSFLQPVRDHFDYIIVDCNPSLGNLTKNALTCAEEVIIPVDSGKWAIEGLDAILTVFDVIKTHVNPSVKLSGVLMTLWDHTKIAEFARETTQMYFEHRFGRNLLYNTVIRRNVKLKEAAFAGIPIYEYDPNSNGVEDYMAFVREVIGQEDEMTKG